MSDTTFVCDCGRSFIYGAAYTKHKLHCDDGKPATSRIAGGTGAPLKASEIILASRDEVELGRAAVRTVARRTGRPRRPVPDAKTARRRETYRKSKRKQRGVVLVSESGALATIAAAATDKATEIVIAGLRAKRDAIDNAITALQAVMT